MEEEYDALITNNTWDLVPHPVGSNIISGKWIFKHKFNFDGNLEWYKAHSVLRGFTQRPSIDYDETFSPVVKLATIHTMLSLAISRSWLIHQLDVKNAFQHDTLSEIVYCSQPMELLDPMQPNQVCRLNKSLNGLKQAPWTWYSRFTTYLLTLRFVEAKSDTSLFVFHCGTDTVYLLLYIDDIVLTVSCTVLLQHTISTLKQEFIMNDLGPLHHFWGSPYNIRQMASSSLSASSLLTSLSTLAWWTASRSRRPWTHRPRSLLLLGLLLLIRHSSGASLGPSNT
jgi:hypothetical protein